MPKWLDFIVHVSLTMNLRNTEESLPDDSFKLHCQSEHGKSDKILDKKRVQCMFCEKIVKRRQLPSHRRTHVIPTNQITCKLCYAVFKTMKAMRKHVRIIHTSKDEMEFRLSGSKDMLKVKCDNEKWEISNLTFLILDCPFCCIIYKVC